MLRDQTLLGLFREDTIETALRTLRIELPDGTALELVQSTDTLEPDLGTDTTGQAQGKNNISLFRVKTL